MWMSKLTVYTCTQLNLYYKLFDFYDSGIQIIFMVNRVPLVNLTTSVTILFRNKTTDYTAIILSLKHIIRINSEIFQNFHFPGIHPCYHFCDFSSKMTILKFLGI